MDPFATLISPEKLRQDLRRFLELPVLQDSLRSQAQAWLHFQEVAVPQTRARDALAGRHRVIEPQEASGAADGGVGLCWTGWKGIH